MDSNVPHSQAWIRMDSASLEHLLRRGDAKVRRQGATHAATRFPRRDGVLPPALLFIVYVKSPPEPLPPSSVWRIGV